jgi:chromosome segregation ATPase
MQILQTTTTQAQNLASSDNVYIVIGEVIGGLVLIVSGAISFLKSHKAEKSATKSAKDADTKANEASDAASAAEATATEFENKIIELKTTISILEQKIAQMETSNTFLLTDYARIRQLLDESQDERESLKTQLRVLENKVSELELRLNQEINEKEALKLENASLREELLKARVEIEALKARLEAAARRGFTTDNLIPKSDTTI